MGDLKDRVSEEIKAAMKAKNKIRLNALRYLKKLFIENDTSTNPRAELDIVVSHAKKIKDSLSQYPEGNPIRSDIEAEIKVLEEYLPKPLTEDAVQILIDEIKSKLDSPNMGAIMKELQPKIKGRFDGKRASDLVKAALN